MKKTLIFVIGIAFALLTGCSENASFIPDDEAMLKGAKKPLPMLVGTTTEFISFETPPYIFVGTIDFSASGMGIYNIAYHVLDQTMKEFANADQLTETFYIYEGGTTPETGSILMSGTNSGVLIGGMRFITNGKVDHAVGPFEGWAGRNVHVNGYVVEYHEAGFPLELSSSFRIN